ncbi:sensory histidine kinase UhpB [Actinomyces bovis]|uniref:Sensory histidine kinase UhpB n=1 Tax=Actinomyces bovis TaxID=1658 RepID=A0ABY1VM33_9ACTO|nr:ATP-binding protein [Actinomyces bovis]SPT52807.1 sensory histidine kinase UhpB [Actinomyces bovis]VEG54852.1 sensory histidine kinase UhpB [Actinomyces israelii]
MTTTRPPGDTPPATWRPGAPVSAPGSPEAAAPPGGPIARPQPDYYGGQYSRPFAYPRVSARLPLRRTPRQVSTPPLAPARPGRWFMGVCAGVAAHLELPVVAIRLLVAATALMGGAGLLLYALLWVYMPAGDPWAEAAGKVPAAQARLATRLTEQLSQPAQLSPRSRTLLGGAALVAAALLLALWRAGHLNGVSDLVPLALLAAGVALAWAQAGTLTGPSRDLGSLLRLLGGVALAAVGILVWLSRDLPSANLMSGVVVGGALVLGIGLILVPLLLRTSRALTDTRAAEARAAERADIAAHLHDSVLQTLTLIRKRADEPETVARLARAQERELRAWLYTDRPEAGTSVSDAFKDLAGEVEDRYGLGIDVVTVGDRAPDQATEVVVAAAREALSNAVRHGHPPVSLYVETNVEGIEVFIRDHGEGFELQEVAADRHGVRESIIGRMERHGGSACVHRLAHGTEIRLTLPTIRKDTHD